MTGFSGADFSFRKDAFRIETKSLNHRFLDIKVRVPREWSTLDIWIRKEIEKYVKRGSVDFWVDRNLDGKSEAISIDIDLAQQAHSKVLELKKRIGLLSEIQVRDILTFPEVLGKGRSPGFRESDQEELKTELKIAIESLFKNLNEMKRKEGHSLATAIHENLNHLQKFSMAARTRRQDLGQQIAEKRRKKIEQCFDAFPSPSEQIKAVLETRIAQEITLILDRTDIEEELVRLEGHIQHFRDALDQSPEGEAGKKLEFLCQELHREVTTLANKAQDLDLSELTVQAKVWVEQIREQVANLE